jgi:15-cis-phytoene synthase
LQPEVKRNVEYSIDTFDQARLYARHYAKTFYFASHVLPRQKREAAYAVYAFCRRADNIVDDAGNDHAGRTRAVVLLQELRDELHDVYDGPADAGRWVALRTTVRAFGIPRGYFLDLIRGVEMDLLKSRFATFAELEEYCYCVASVVGLIMARIFGVSTSEALRHAAELGTAMQLTNILRDVGEDLRMGRIYLPQDELMRFGVSESDLQAGRPEGQLRALLEFQVTRARSYYRSAGPGIAMIPDDGSRFCAEMMSTLYSRILDAVEANGYDVFTRRAHVPLPVKIRVAAAIGLRRKILRRSGHPPAGRPGVTPDNTTDHVPSDVRASQRQ